MEVFEHLPAANYVVKVDQYGVYFLEGIDSFTMPKKVYGANDNRRDRIIKTFLDRPRQTGVLLSGEKGSGKTLLTKSLSIELAATHDIPTLIVNTAFFGETFNKFIQTIQQPTVILFDEFEKVYDKQEQEQLLTLLDGVFPSKKLFLLTMNTGYLDPHMRNRPGRIFYQWNYFGLDSVFMREYCEDCLNDKTQIDKFIEIAECFSAFNFDMLTAVVEDMNRYGEKASTAMQSVNARIENDHGVMPYLVDCYINGKLLTAGNFNPNEVHMSPLALPADSKPYFNIYDAPKGTKDEEGIDEHWDIDNFRLNDDMLINVEQGGNLVYEYTDPKQPGLKVRIRIIKPGRKASFNFDAF